MIRALGKFRRHAETPVALVQITRARHVFKIRHERPVVSLRLDRLSRVRSASPAMKLDFIAFNPLDASFAFTYPHGQA